MSPASASVATSASSPSMIERACLPEPPCDCLIATSWPGLGLPVLGEGLVVVHVQFARRVVRHVEQGHGSGANDGSAVRAMAAAAAAPRESLIKSRRRLMVLVGCRKSMKPYSGSRASKRERLSSHCLSEQLIPRHPKRRPHGTHGPVHQARQRGRRSRLSRPIPANSASASGRASARRPGPPGSSSRPCWSTKTA